MKKIFTLVAAAFMAVCANAQGTYAIPDDGSTPEDNMVITDVPNITVTLGTGFKENKSNTNLPEFVAYTQGNSNASFGEDGITPVSGTYYEFKPAVDGSLKVGAVIGNGKEFRAVCDGAYMTPGTDFTLVNKDGETVELAEDNTLAEKFYGYVNFDVKANSTYYLYMKGSKMSFYGFIFTTSGTTGISDLTADKADANAPVYNLAGQRVSKDTKGILIQNGKKFINNK